MATVGFSIVSIISYMDLTHMQHVDQIGFFFLVCGNKIYCRRLCLEIHIAYTENLLG